MLSRRISALALIAALCAPSLPATAQPLLVKSDRAQPLRIEGRAAQALHCSAMLFMVGGVMYDAGLIARIVRDDAQRAALIMLDHVPGTDAQRVQAMSQRFERIMKSRSPAELVEEYERSDQWCRREFLPR